MLFAEPTSRSELVARDQKGDYRAKKADLRLPLAIARERRLVPDLSPIRTDMMGAVENLYGEFFADNPRMPFDGQYPTCPDSELNEAQRALLGVWWIGNRVAPWEWLSLLLDDRPALPRIIWAARTADIGRTGEYIEHLVRMVGGNPDSLAAAYAENSDVAGSLTEWGERKFDPLDPIRAQSVNWWSSDGPGRADFNKRAFDFALRRLPELIALDDDTSNAIVG